jgi:parallel beta-helix repeat protein
MKMGTGMYSVRLGPLFILFFSITIQSACFAQLSGTYTVDPNDGPFPNFTSVGGALDSLRNQGVSGPVVFNLADGNYYGQYHLSPIDGASPVNTITFQGNETDSTKVRLYFNQTTDNGGQLIWVPEGSAHYIFRKMTLDAGNGPDYARILRSGFSADFGITIENCFLKGRNTTNNSTDYALVYHMVHLGTSKKIVYRNNFFANGSYGIYLHGYAGGAYAYNFRVTDNKFLNQNAYGIYLMNCSGVKVENNEIFLDNGAAYGIRLDECDNNSSVRGNNITVIGGWHGIFLVNCVANAVDKAVIANNFIRIESGAVANGLHMSACSYQMVYHNSVSNNCTDPMAAALFTESGDHMESKNNILVNTGGGYALYTETPGMSSSDYNNYFTNWNTAFARWENIERPTLESLQSANGMDAHSVSVHPRFFSEFDLHTSTYWLDSLGSSETGILTDFDGEPRSFPPDIGADEFDPVPPLSGTYKIGGESPDYLTMKEAFEDLQVKGVGGPATFEIRKGEYPELIGLIHEIPGASHEDSIVFQSESGNPDDVILHYSTDISERVILMLSDVGHFTLKDISMTVTGMDNGLALYLIGDCRNINILNNRFASENTADNLLQITQGKIQDVQIENNSFSKGLHGIYLSGTESDYSTGTGIRGNSFSGSLNNAIFLGYQIAPEISYNVISNSTNTGFIPIEFIHCNGDLRIVGNTITNGPGDSGIKMANCVATQPFKGLVANNMIQVGGNLQANGIWISDSRRQNIYFNSINITGSDSILGRGIFIQDNNEEINIVNNIVANNGGGYALYVNDPVDITRSDHNGLFSSGLNLASWGGIDHADQSSLTISSGMDENSLSVAPEFISDTDLHTDQMAYMGAATPLEEVKFDIDGHLRDTVSPDIGAMEFYCETPDFDIEVSVTCIGDTTIFIDHSANITDGASYSWDFDGDFSPEIISATPHGTVTHLYDTAGSYTLVFIVEQVEGCKDKFEIPVEVIAPPKFNIKVQGAYCNNQDGEATVQIIDGAGTYTYYWSEGSTDSIARNLELGTYTVAVSDSNGCTSAAEITIEDAMEVDVTEIRSSSCGLSDGIAEVRVTGGVEPYRYVWSNGDTTAVDSTLSPGLHYVNVIDANGCYARGSIVIEHDGSGPYISHKGTVHNDCFGDRMGAIDIKAGGGTPPYKILWSNGDSTEHIDSLAGGIFDVWIVDSDSCPTTDSYLVREPPAISIGVVVEDASCLDNDGRAGALVSGGTEPYRYSWSTGGVSSTEENLAAGIHSVSIVDANGCKAEKPVVVNSVGGPVLTLKALSGVTCSDSLGGMIEVSTKGGTWPYEWLWSPGGQTTPKINNLPIGTYEVKVTDDAGCTGFNIFDIIEEPPAIHPICLVTVDSLSGNNMVVWEKAEAEAEGILFYNVYREGSLKGDYQLVASVRSDKPGLYVDPVADPSIRSWRYRLSAVDVCGHESEFSEPHKTMHLTMNLGLENSVNLIWDHYEGFPVDRYEILRYDATSGWNSIASMPSDLTSRTDPNPPKEDLTYYIEIDHPYGCTYIGKKASTLNSSRSNRIHRLKSQPTGSGILHNTSGLWIYPNPGSGLFHLQMNMNGTSDILVRIFDFSGKLLKVREYESVSSGMSTELNLTGFASGIYHIQVKSKNAFYNGILIKE